MLGNGQKDQLGCLETARKTSQAVWKRPERPVGLFGNGQKDRTGCLETAKKTSRAACTKPKQIRSGCQETAQKTSRYVGETDKRPAKEYPEQFQCKNNEETTCVYSPEHST